MEIKTPQLKIDQGVATLTYPIEFLGKTTHLCYTVSEKYSYFLTENCDAALIALVLPAMQAKEDIVIVGKVSETLYHNMNSIMQVCRALIPSLSSIHITATLCSDQGIRAPGVATGFSAGIDSFCTLADYQNIQLPSFRITHLLYNNVGSHGAAAVGGALFLQRLKNVTMQAQSFNLPLIWVNSNLDDFYAKTPQLNFAQTHTMRNASVPHLLSKGIGKFFYSSAFPVNQTVVGKKKYMGYIDPIILPLMTTNALQTFLVGATYTRVEKTLKVGQIVSSYTILDVCTKPHGEQQCSSCKKCLRTLLTLEIGGFLSYYHKRFNLTLYKKKKNLYLAKILKSSDPLAMEIKEFIHRKNFNIPLRSRLYACIPFLK